MTAPFDFDAFVERLRCPACRAPVAFAPARQPASARGLYGVLRCPCAAYPVVDGVPVFTRGPVAVRSIADARMLGDGPMPETLVRQIEAGQGEAALVSLLAFPVCPWPLNLTAAGPALSQAGPPRAAGLAARRRTLRRWLRADDRTAEDWFSLFYWRSATLFDPFSYFFFRFAQPRHLAALALLPALPVGRPVLDLACGYGHLLHNLTADAAPREAVGVDQNFHQVWVARHWIAPAAQFVCSDAECPPPFADAAFGAALCADAFHCVHDKAACLDELRRCAAGGTIVLARVGNARVAPHEGEELAPEAYLALLAPWARRLYDEDALVDAYLRRETPDLAAPTGPAGVADRKSLYAVAAEREAAFPLSAPLGAWPHAAGALALNPRYEERAEGAAHALRFRFPSPWYAFENARMADYHAGNVVVEAGVLDDLAHGRRSEGVAALVEQFVVLGLPDRYARPRGRPRAMYAHRALTCLTCGIRSRATP